MSQFWPLAPLTDEILREMEKWLAIKNVSTLMQGLMYKINMTGHAEVDYFPTIPLSALFF